MLIGIELKERIAFYSKGAYNSKSVISVGISLALIFIFVYNVEC